MDKVVRKPYDKRMRRLAALRLAAGGMTFKEIGAQMGFSTDRANQLVGSGWHIIVANHPELQSQVRMVEIRRNPAPWLEAIDRQISKIEQNLVSQPGDADLAADPLLLTARLTLSMRARNCLHSAWLDDIESLLQLMEEKGVRWSDDIVNMGVVGKKEVEDAMQGFERARNALQQTPKKGCAPDP